MRKNCSINGLVDVRYRGENVFVKITKYCVKSGPSHVGETEEIVVQFWWRM